MVETKPNHQRNVETVKKQKPKQDSFSRNRRVSPNAFSHTDALVKTERQPSPPYQYGRDLSISPPPSYGYSYSLPEPVIHAPYPQHAPFNTLRPPYHDYASQPQYVPSLPTLPSMPQYEIGPSKTNGYLGEEILGQYETGYTPFASINLPMQQSYPESNVHVSHPKYDFHLLVILPLLHLFDYKLSPRSSCRYGDFLACLCLTSLLMGGFLKTPPLSHSHSFEYSRAGSPALTFPGTPVSIPDSPRLVIR